MGEVNVLVHGLFFMRLSENARYLELIAPTLAQKHNFLGGVRGQLVTLNGDAIWTNIGLTGNPIANLNDVKSSILQFSINDTGLSDWKRQNFFGTITLPWPLGFFSIRCDFFDRSFLYDTNFPNIASNIKAKCRKDANSKVSFITCLQYRYTGGVAFPGWTPGTNLHCYYEPCKKHSITEVNKDLSDAASIFVNQDKFDLQMDQKAGDIFTPRGEPCPNLPNSLDVDDDYSFPEDPLRFSQGICKPLITENINPANCPNFFVGP
jgi:hypothetical protein